MSGTYSIRKGSRWYVAVYCGVDPNTKRQRYKWHSGFASKREADAFRATLASHPQFSAGLGLYGNTRQRLGDFLDEWLRSHGPNIRERTREGYERLLRVHVKPELAHVPLARLSPHTIQSLYRKRLEAGVGSSTVAHVARVLSEALRFAVRRGLIARNPCEQTDPPREKRARPQVWNVAQTQAFLTEAKASSPHFLLYSVALASGLRQGELFGLRWSDVDLSSGMIHVSQTLERPGRNPKFGDTKTERSHRSVLLPLPLIEELKRWRVRQNEVRLKQGSCYRNFDLVFCAKSGRPLHPRNIVRRDFYAIIKRGDAQLKKSGSPGLPQITFHGLRHIHATLLVASGVDIRTVSDRLGHATPGFTLSVYAHALPGTQEKAVAAFNEFLTKPAGSSGS